MAAKGHRRKTTASKDIGGKNRGGNEGSIHIGDISGGTGFAIGHAAQAKVSQTTAIGTGELAAAFGELRQKLAVLPQTPDKSVAENAINALEAEAKKGDQASEGSVEKWMRFLADTAPDIWEVAVDTFTNPIKGLGTVFMKIAKRAKAGQDAKGVQASKRNP